MRAADPVYDSPPWRSAHEATSPDGRHRAWMSQASEIGMGDPTYGDLVVDGVFTLSDCSPAFIWSQDSCYVAVPRWVRRYGLFMRQQLLVWNAEEHILALAAPYYRLLILERFDPNRLEIVDSPFRKPKHHSLSLSEFKPVSVESLHRRLPDNRH